MSIKRKLILFSTGVFCFILLFHHQSLGINASLFALAAWLLFSGHQGAFRLFDRKFWILSGLLLLSAGSFAFYGDGFSFFALFLSFYIVGIYLTDKKFHVLLYPLLMLYSFASFIVRIFFLDRWLPKWSNKKSQMAKSIHTILVPLTFAVLFLIIYALSSAMFSEMLSKMFPQFDGTLILIAMLGFFLLFNFMYLLPITQLFQLNDYISGWNASADSNKKIPESVNQENAVNTRGSFITLILLNTLLVFFLITYNYEQYSDFHGHPLSKSVHEQVNTVILSIVMAVGVIMYYFRPAMQMAGHSRRLNMAAYLWILLNGLLVISAGIINSAYICQFGLTFKRIGVYIFLVLSFIGLFLTWTKIRNHRSNFYLITLMLKIIFMTFVLNSAVNWSRIITRYNLHYMAKPDLPYLESMDYNKEILYRHFKNDKNWQKHFYEEKNQIISQQQKSFLSKKLYYEWLRKRH